MKIDRDFFNANGYVIVKNVFTIEEVEKFRQLAYQTLEEDKSNKLVKKVVSDLKDVYYPKGDLLSKSLNEVLLSDKILKIAETILEEKPVYFQDSTYQIGIGDRGFHRDNVDRIANQGEDWQGDYDIIRIGVYMQDHDKFSGGLKVVKKSHKGIDGKRVFIDSKAGDVVVWNLRTLHSGNAARLKILPNLVMGYRLENLLPSFLIKDSQQERISCFMSFGKEGPHLNRYIEKYMKVKMGDHLKHSEYFPVEGKLNNKFVTIKKVWSE
ncbi:phytanoyl-CoA dioxygenase family protein [Pedobacter hiemivivus]|uniref:Phytanoyl-CoA dioxygenase family protein n=1 Tax=Pedobacter hiemivivus TaxID=2530454 RepID=A0A4U1G1E4_9SPHI|nr:phytanoyl-CoA dioxygenase family protein [Pedobacter hiemivivus]TKC56954.1 phytanoyl-CoA dioxygenase family protein [Pedobacter hiemivivus]